jgi:hypothetical protein
MESLPFRAFNRIMIRYSNMLFRGVLSTPPIQADPSSDIVAYSILCKRDVRAYLLSAKSFLRYCPPLNVVVQSDGSLDSAACQELRAHVKNLAILTRESTEEFLRERLSKPLLRLISETNFWVELKLLNPVFRYPGRYVIHLDSDLLFLRRPDAVVDCITANPPRTFHSPGGNVLAEPFHEIGFDFSKVDIRSFNAGFIGFVNRFPDDAVVTIADAIRKHDPSLLKVWDVEQAIWSVLLNQCPNPLNLGTFGRDYVGNGWASYAKLRDKATLVHFIGATRFRNLMYVRFARQTIGELQRNLRSDPG